MPGHDDEGRLGAGEAHSHELRALSRGASRGHIGVPLYRAICHDVTDGQNAYYYLRQSIYYFNVSAANHLQSIDIIRQFLYHRAHAPEFNYAIDLLRRRCAKDSDGA